MNLQLSVTCIGFLEPMIALKAETCC